MRRRKPWTVGLGLLGLSLLLGASLILLTLPSAFGQALSRVPWTGKLADGRIITQADLDQILQAHALWLKSGRKEGQRANLSGADLNNANLSGANLS